MSFALRFLSVLALPALFLSACDPPPLIGGGDGDGGTDLRDLTGVSTDVLTISPLDAVVTITNGTITPLGYSATLNGQSVTAAWAINRGELGSMGANTGQFTPLGDIGGKGIVTASVNGITASTSVTVKLVQTQNGDPAYPAPAPGPGGYGGVGGNGPGGPASGTQITTLGGTPTADAAVQWLYPYNHTVFPRGLLAPLMQWNPGTHNFDSLRLQITSKANTYSFDGTFAKPGAKPFVNLPIPQDVWRRATFSSGGDELTITVTFGEGASAVGPISEQWVVAAGTLKGLVYYNSYGTALVINSNRNDKAGNQFGAATLSINPGNPDPVLVAGKPSGLDGTGCRVCHSVAANGSRLITQKFTNDDQDSSLVDLKNSNSESNLSAGNAAFPAMYPDGSRFFSSSGGMRNPDPAGSNLYLLPAGTKVASPPGLPAGLQAALPAFSPDGKVLAFTFYGGTGSDKVSLAAMSFDATNNSFGTIDMLHKPANGPALWPSFLPSSKAIVFENEIETHEWGFTRGGNKGKLWWFDIAARMPTELTQLNGGNYLPTNGTHPDDTQLNYEPTVNPVPSGGYAWVVFTSRRIYGNVATQDPKLSDPGDYDWKNNATTKKLWVAAIDLNATAGADPSHPAFYLPSQELYAGNSRGFWTVDPCHADGATCETGDECCGGYCQPGGDAGALQCTMVAPMCAHEFEKCAVDADCCPPSTIDPGAMPLQCINNLCVNGSAPIP